MFNPGYEEAACHGKQRFGTHKMAAQVAKRPRRQYDSGLLQPYRCPLCQGWHIGTAGKPPEKASDIKNRRQFEARRVWQGKPILG